MGELQNEINRRCEILQRFKGKKGVILNFFSNISKDYTYFTDIDTGISTGLYHCYGNQFFYIKECSIDVLYRADSITLSMLEHNGKDVLDLGCKSAKDELESRHRADLNIQIDNRNFVNARRQVDILEALSEDSLDEYLKIICSKTDSICNKIYDENFSTWINALSEPFKIN